MRQLKNNHGILALNQPGAVHAIASATDIHLDDDTCDIRASRVRRLSNRQDMTSQFTSGQTQKPADGNGNSFAANWVPVLEVPRHRP